MNRYQKEAIKRGLVIEVDDKSGFCFGVSRAVKIAENHLKKEGVLFSSGDIVHNEEEVSRLRDKGMVTIDSSTQKDLTNKMVLFRAHGEPPVSYQKMKEKGANVLDATCPVVVKLQDRVRNAWVELQPLNGQVAIYGKKGHAEVVGLVGQTNDEAIVLDKLEDVRLLDPNKKTALFSQTTKSKEGLDEMEGALRQYLTNPDDLNVYRTICAQVGNRVPHLKEFASKFSLVLFVAGAKSSNGRVLYEVCKNANAQTFYISSSNEIKPDWLKELPKSVGICGATSTPNWLMEDVCEEFSKLWLNQFNEGGAII